MSIRMEFKELGAEENSDTDRDLDSVKALTEKLKLQTRRPSYLEWKERLQCQPWRAGEKGQDGSEVQCPNKTKDEDLKEVDVLKSSSSSSSTGSKSASKDGAGTLQNICGFDTMDDALNWLRKELREMQMQDNQLARQLMKLRGEINQLKVEQVCHHHKEMLDDATYGLEECGEESDLLCDIPLKAAFSLSTPSNTSGHPDEHQLSRFSLC
ncbi:protein FAM167A-like [Acipenser oxyrinchus oxyrinchus]|uniref:Protein FAM167A-like n=1 Tax=Acipenser oxyrinchus oxyrinchus TaxID=40147 RepID=A0AAD8CGC5_ACIOX|nr:protein FAM167A-like [Acipenser oxyrinchus oxyrinchus]